MTLRLLAVDVGNTHTTIGLFDEKKLTERWRMATRVARTADELWVFLLQFLHHRNILENTLSAVAISSVVPELTFAYAQMCRDRLGKPPFVITHERVHSLKIDYDPPSSVGADRLCGAVAAYAKYGGPLVIVDLGTATVFDVVDDKAVYRGGLILPGIQTSVEALHQKAALLPRVELTYPAELVGRTTEAAIQSGVLVSAVVTIDAIVEKIQHQYSKPLKVVATGGFAEMLQPHCRTLDHVEPNLVLEGIRLIAEQQ
ncbi:type III pantothenate kinase [candidate division KSB1 bacterium]|nr:MAG: type III pantothenate kinase [candidate division KSB1 bacterium]